jgi:hypothetical protein
VNVVLTPKRGGAVCSWYPSELQEVGGGIPRASLAALSDIFILVVKLTLANMTP